MDDLLTKLLASQALVTRDGADRIFTSPTHLAIAMRLAMYGKASTSELGDYLRRMGLSVASISIDSAVSDFKRFGYVSGSATEGLVAERPLVDAVRRRAPSREHLESNSRPSTL